MGQPEPEGAGEVGQHEAHVAEQGVVEGAQGGVASYNFV